MNIQHVQVKLFAEQPVDLAPAIPVFHSWIQSGSGDELLIDVADYRHVPDGPGVVLVAHEAFYSLNSARGRMGLLYSRRTPLDGSTGDKLFQAARAAIAACRRLEQEPAFGGALRFSGAECEVSINDRMLAPNNDGTFQALEPDLRALFDALWGSGAYTIERAGDPRELFRVTGKSGSVVPLIDLALR